MAKYLYLLFSLFIVHQVSSSHHQHHHHLKSLHFSLYQHETINKTGFIIVEGITGNTGVSQTTTPFGTIFVFNDKMTTTTSATSRVAGITEGFSVTSSLDGLRSVSAAKITLNVEGHEGSISILGGTHNTKPSDHPVVGGTGDFMFVGGYVRSSPVSLTGVTVVYCEHLGHVGSTHMTTTEPPGVFWKTKKRK